MTDKADGETGRRYRQIRQTVITEITSSGRDVPRTADQPVCVWRRINYWDHSAGSLLSWQLWLRCIEDPAETSGGGGGGWWWWGLSWILKHKDGVLGGGAARCCAGYICVCCWGRALRDHTSCFWDVVMLFLSLHR